MTESRNIAFKIANSDNYKTQLMETGRLEIYTIHWIDLGDLVDAVRQIADELGIERDDLIIGGSGSNGFRIWIRSMQKPWGNASKDRAP